MKTTNVERLSHHVLNAVAKVTEEAKAQGEEFGYPEIVRGIVDALVQVNETHRKTE